MQLPKDYRHEMNSDDMAAGPCGPKSVNQTARHLVGLLRIDVNFGFR